MSPERYNASVASVLDGEKIFGADEGRDDFGERLGVIIKKSRTKCYASVNQACFENVQTASFFNIRANLVSFFSRSSHSGRE